MLPPTGARYRSDVDGIALQKCLEDRDEKAVHLDILALLRWRSMRKAIVLIVAITSILASGVLTRAQSQAQQAQCATRARVTIQEDNAKWVILNRQGKLGYQTISFEWQSHYNPKIQRCLILATRVTSSGNVTQTTKKMYDAFERRDYGGYLLSTSSATPLFCELPSNDGQRRFCKSQEEFEAIAAEYMEQ